MGSNLVAVTWFSGMAPVLSKEFLDIQANYGVLILSETRVWHDNNIQSNAPYRKVLTTQLNDLASLAKCFSVCLRTKWLQVRISLLSLKIQIWLFILRFFNNNCCFFFFNNFLRFTFYLGRYVFFFLLTFQFLLTWSFFVILFCFLFLFKLNLAYSLIFYFPEKVSYILVLLVLKAWRILVLSYLFFVLWFESLRLENHFQVLLAYLLFCCFFLLILFMLKIQSKHLRCGIFFLHLKTQSPCYCIAKSKMSPAIFDMKLYAKCCVCQLTSCDWKLALTHLEIF